MPPPNQYSMERQQANAMDMINPYEYWFDSLFWKWQAMRLAPMSMRMLPGLSNEQKWASMIRAPYGTRSLLMPKLSPSDLGQYRALDETLAARGKTMSEAERIATRKRMYETILTGEPLDDQLEGGRGKKRLKGVYKSKTIRGREIRWAKGGTMPGFFIGQLVGSAFDLDIAGQITAGVAGSVAVKATGGVAPLLHRKGLTGSASLATQLALGARSDVAKRVFDFTFGVRDAYEGLHREMNRSLRGVFGERIREESRFAKGYRRFVYRTATGIPTATGIGLTPLQEHVSKTLQYETLPRSFIDDLMRFKVSETRGVMNSAIRSAVFERGKYGRFKDLFVTERGMRKRLAEGLTKEMRSLISRVGTGKGVEYEAVKEAFEEAPGFVRARSLAQAKYTTAKLGRYAKSKEGEALIQRFVNETMDSRASNTAVKEMTRNARRVGRMAVGGAIIGTVTTGLVAAEAIIGGYKMAIQGMSALTTSLRSLTRYDFGSGIAVETPQATSERAMAMQSIQNALGMGRSLMGNEAALVH